MGRKKKCPPGHHGGSWKVAFADFMTAMFALFLLLWLVSLKPEVKQGIENYFKYYSIYKKMGTSFKEGSSSIVVMQSNTGLNKKKPESVNKYSKEAAEKKNLEKKIDKELKEKIKQELGATNDQVIIEKFKDGFRIQLVDKEGKPLFKLGSSDLTDSAKKALDIIAEKIKEADAKIAIEGHTDALTYSSNKYTNWELSTERASSARRELEDMGVSPDNVVMVTGYAATRPLVKDNVNDPKNRRISILVNMKHEGVAEMNSAQLKEISTGGAIKE